MSRANFGLSPHDWSIFSQNILKPLQAAGARIWIFGSRARGTERSSSDIDVLVDFPIWNDETKKIVRDIRLGMEESSITIKVDLVSYPDIAESYKKNILTEKIEVKS